MAKKSTKKSETESVQPLPTDPEAAAKPKKKRATKKAKLADPIGDMTDGEAQAALEPVTMPDAEIAAAEDNAETKAEAVGAAYVGSAPDTEAEPQSDASFKPKGSGGFTPRAKMPKKARASKSAEKSPALKGHDFSRAVSATKESPALAAEGRFSPSLDEPASEMPLAIPATSETHLEDKSPEDAPDPDESEPETKPRPPAKLDRLQKILAQAGVASRRKAEEMIEQGRVQVNGKVVTILGTKADAARDHIRVDGKLLQGAEHLRYFVLNKPRGFVTTVKDPEGRPTVMQFFDKMRERLYPVGRLDYMSEGLLLVTNDGELANRLTRAATGVEKTYLVKVAGQPTEAELDQLRSGVAIEHGKPGSAKVRTAPARIRQVRQGDNPWYEVVLIEGRNRELRKMFEEIGHFVEKIRRVGYGPLVLDQEPGNLRELDPQELALLRQAADGTLRTPKTKDLRRRNLIDAGKLPTVAPRPTPQRPARPFRAKSFEERPAAGPKDYRPKKSFDTGAPANQAGPAHQAGPAGKNFRPSRFPDTARPSGPARFADGQGYRPSGGQGYRPFGRPSARPAWQKDDRTSQPPSRFAPGARSETRPPAGRNYGAKPFENKPFRARPFAAKPFEARPAAGRSFESKPPSNRPFAAEPASRPYGDRPQPGKPFAAKPGFTKPAWNKSGPKDRPPFKQPSAPRRESRVRDDESGPVRPPNLRIEEIHASERSSPARSSPARPSPARPGGSRPAAPYARPGRPSPDRPRPDRPRPDGPGQGRPRQGRPNFGRPSSARPFRSEGGPPRPFTTSSGKPRAGGARPSSKPGRSSSAYNGKPSGSASKHTGKPGGKKRR
jgi:23S rRNA pseudouridine2605 synthase